ncbi:hypothetical protein NIF40_03135 [[Clostridium] leptum]|nr:hypothetical protein [[Clostridium] leptum]
MKPRRLMAFLCSIVFIFVALTGCSALSDPGSGSTADLNSVPNAFSTLAKVQYNGIEIEAKITRLDGGDCTIEVLSPSSLKSLAMDWNAQSNTMTLGFMGLSCSIDPQQFPDSAFGSAVISVFNAVASKDGLQIDKTDELLTFSGTGESGQFSVSIDRKTGSMQSLEIPSIGLSAQFSEYTSQ